MAGRRKSAGLIMFRRVNGETEVFLAHPGGPENYRMEQIL